MSLAPGTAFQNGHFVIDALLESAPNGDLYWGTHVVAGMPVFIQVFPLIADASIEDLSGLIARLEGVAFSPRSPLPNPFQLFRGEDQTLCLAMSTTVGLPWTATHNHCSPLSPKGALRAIRTVADHVSWLRSQGLTGLDLSPNRIWLSDNGETITLTGLPQTHLQTVEASDQQPQTAVEQLAKLLYSFLTGELFPEQVPLNIEPIRADLFRRNPQFSPVMVDAIAQGLRTSQSSNGEPLTLEQWLDQLPDAGETQQVLSPTHRLTPGLAASHGTKKRPRKEAPASEPSQRRRKVGPALIGTALVAAIAGVGLGSIWRLNAAALPGAMKFEPKQTFPPRAGWSGDTPEAAFEAPFMPGDDDFERQEDWLVSPAPEQPAWEDTTETVVSPEDLLVPNDSEGVTEPGDAAVDPDGFAPADELPGVGEEADGESLPDDAPQQPDNLEDQEPVFPLDRFEQPDTPSDAGFPNTPQPGSSASDAFESQETDLKAAPMPGATSEE